MHVAAILLCLLSIGIRAQSLQSVGDSIKALALTDPTAADSLAMGFLFDAQESGNDSLLMRAHYLTGLTKYYIGQYYLSTDFYRKAINNRVAESFPGLVEASWNNIGINYDLQGNYPGSLEAYQQSLKFAENRGDSLSIAQSWINIGLLENRTGSSFEGLEVLERAEKFFNRKRDTFHLALVYQNKAAIFESLGNWEEVFLNSDKAAQFFEHKRHPSLEVTARSNMALALIYLRKFDQAYPLIQGVFDRGRDLKSTPNISTAFYMLGEYHKANSRWSDAYAAFDSALVLAQESGIYNKLDGLYFSMLESATYMERKDLIKSAIQQYQDFREDYLSSRIAERYSELSTQYKLEDKVEEIQQQREELTNNKKQLLNLLLIAVLLGAALLIVFVQYLSKAKLTKALYQKNKELIARTAPKLERVDPNEEGQAQNQESSDIDQSPDDKLKNLFQKLDESMRNDKLYLESSLTVSDLSQLMKVNELYISRAINLFGGENFNTYINTYRIEEAQRLIQVHKGKIEMNMLALKCGFNSYTTFFRFFKEHTGLTPSSYLKQVQADTSTAS